MSEDFQPQTDAEKKAHDEAYYLGLAAAQKLISHQDNQDLHEENARLQEEVDLDPKLRIKSYIAFKEKVRTHMAEKAKAETSSSSERAHPESMAIAILDLDDFKLINTKLGYEDADSICLIPTATIVGDRVKRTDDMFAESGRFGGEEIVVFLDGTDLDGATSVMKDIKTKVNQITYEDDGEQKTLGASIGISSFGHGVEFEDAFKSANYALQRAKEIEGKNQIVATHYLAPGASVENA